MKKILLTAACLFVASPASATIISNIYLEFYDASGIYTGYRSDALDVIGSLNTTVANGHLVDTYPFFGANWLADEVWVSTTAGKNTWAGQALTTYAGAQTAFNYTFTLAAGNVAFGLYFDWEVNNNIPILSVMHPEADGSWSPVDPIWYKGTSTTPKQGMQTAPFPGQRALFGAYATPEPASLLLIGSGLAGLVGVARRRK